MTPEQIARAFNDHGVPLIRDEDEIPERDEDVTELSDAEYHGYHERFTPRD